MYRLLLQIAVLRAVFSHETNMTFQITGEKGPPYIASDEIEDCTGGINSGETFDQAFHCPQSDSLYKLFEKFKGEINSIRMKIRVKKVDGELTLQPPPSIIIVSLSLLNANVTRITSQKTERQSPLAFLHHLDLRNNPLFDLEQLQQLIDLRSLTYLNLSETPVTRSTLTSLLPRLPALRYLDISLSGLRVLPETAFDKNPDLERLDLSNNELRTITFPEALTRKLQYLNISSCGLDEVTVSPCPRGLCPAPSSRSNLMILDVSSNHLMWLPRRLVKSLTEYSYVDIRDNKWSDACHRCPLYYLWQYSNTASRVVGKEELSCFSRAVLRNCSWEDCPAECDCDRESKTVSCTGKGMETLPAVVPSETETFLVNNNSLVNVHNLNSPVYCNLKNLSVENNLLTQLLLPGGKGQCYCHTDEEYYTEKSQCYPQHLNTLSLQNNDIERLTASDCQLLYPLRELRLSRNKMATLGAQMCGSLQRLRHFDLSYNNITTVTFSDLATYPSLQYLNLSHNALETFEIVPYLKSALETLDVGYNRLKKLTGWNKTEPIMLFGTQDCLSNFNLILENNPLIFTRTNCSPQVKCKNVEDCFSTQKENRQENNMTKSDVLKTFVACVIIVAFFLNMFYVCAKPKVWRCSPQGPVEQENEEASRCQYSVFVVHSSKDREIVRNGVIIPLCQRGYSVAWHENAFVPGAWILENIEMAVRNSARMLIFATDNLAASRYSLQEIRRGRYEEMERDGFRILALVTDTLPKALKPDLYETVALRTHVQYSDRDYLQKICNFLPPPLPVHPQDASPQSSTTINIHLDRFDEIRRGHRNENVSEIVHFCRDNEGYVIDQYTASITKGAKMVPWPHISPEERNRMIERYRVNPRMPPECYTETGSLNYVLLAEKDEMSDGEDSFQFDTFMRCSSTRISCRF
ncbi:toll-like receptor 5 isoform X1 [Penaeus japonicus]|uniref:toll-like receptor 5 isoform X1 n=1 Tax=Penaeus japonicus TaxID=27405 RepID=UPI001C714BB3|nr:toll-like receptor 5 isoform X1 [Penaeus japonicus]